MDTSHPYDSITRRGFFVGSGLHGPVERGARAQFDAAVNRRIYRAYQQLQRARLDGNYQRIVKWQTRVDDLLDKCMERQMAADGTPASWAPVLRRKDTGGWT